MTVALIRRTAKDLAGKFYEGQMQFEHKQLLENVYKQRSDRFRKGAGPQKDYIAQYWPKFVPAARSILAQMLTMPGYNDHIKAEIYDALLKDQQRATDEDEAKILAPATAMQ